MSIDIETIERAHAAEDVSTLKMIHQTARRGSVRTAAGAFALAHINRSEGNEDAARNYEGIGQRCIDDIRNGTALEY